MKSKVEMELPSGLLDAANRHVSEGWAGDLNELVAEALRRYLDSHGSELNDSFVREDVEWGLRGNN